MNTKLDKLIGHLEKARAKECSCKQRVQAQASVQGVVDTLRMAGPIGMAIASAAMAILWSAQEGPKLVKALSDLMSGTPAPLTLTQEQLIQQAIATAQAKTVADFRAGTQSDYGLSFTGAQNQAGDAGLSFTQSPTWNDVYDSYYQDAVAQSPQDPCGWLSAKREDLQRRVEKWTSEDYYGSAPGRETKLIYDLEYELLMFTEAMKRHCGGSPSARMWPRGTNRFGGAGYDELMDRPPFTLQ